MKLVKPKKFLGQHFLKDLKVAQDIADTVDTFPELPVLEKLTTSRLLIFAKPIRHWKTTSSRMTS